MSRTAELLNHRASSASRLRRVSLCAILYSSPEKIDLTNSTHPGILKVSSFKILARYDHGVALVAFTHLPGV